MRYEDWWAESVTKSEIIHVLGGITAFATMVTLLPVVPRLLVKHHTATSDMKAISSPFMATPEF